jgi:hypothetical protein
MLSRSPAVDTSAPSTSFPVTEQHRTVLGSMSEVQFPSAAQLQGGAPLYLGGESRNNYVTPFREDTGIPSGPSPVIDFILPGKQSAPMVVFKVP